MQKSSIQGDPAALTNFHSAGFGEVTGLAISIVLHVYLEESEICIAISGITTKPIYLLARLVTNMQDHSFTRELMSQCYWTFPNYIVHCC